MNRDRYLAKIAARFEIQPVVTLLGPRQCGKTTLARAEQRNHRLDLESGGDLRQVAVSIHA